jgi:cell division protein FtsB
MNDRRPSTEPRGARPRPIAWHGRLGWPKIAMAVAVAALVLLTLSSARMLFARHELAQRAASLRAEIATLEDESARLQRELTAVQSDAGIERLARETLGWAKPGESAVVIGGLETPTPRPTPAATPRPSALGGLWERLRGR